MPRTAEVAHFDLAKPPASIFRNRNFILLWCAYTTSALGDHLSEMALLGMQDATEREDSTRILAIITFAIMLPFFLVGPAMGWLADRLPRKRIMIAADLSRAVLMFGLAGIFSLLFASFAGTPWELRPASQGLPPIFNPWLYALPLFATGFFAAMFSPARAAMLPTLIRPDQFVRGNGLMAAMGPIATIASFVIGAELFSRYGEKVNFQVDGLTFLLSATILAFIRPPARTAVRAKTARQNDRLIDGLRYCRTHRRVIELILFTVLFWSAAGVVRSVIPALVGQVFGGDIRDIGYYQATLGIGMLSGAMLLAYLGDTLPSQIAISWSLFGAGAATVWLAIVAVFEFSPLAGGIGLFVTGMFGSGILVSANALLQRIVPDHFRGRVFGVKDLASVGGMILTTGFLGIPAWEHIDRYVPALLAGVGVVLLAGGIVSVLVRLRRGKVGPMLNFYANLNSFYCRLWPRMKREGICTIPIQGPVIVVANHNSTLDPFVLTACSPNRVIGFMVAVEFTEIPILRHMLKAGECVPVTRSGVDTASIKAALRHLAAGKVLGVFPQGGIQRPDEPVEVREGVGMLALRSGATVIPAYVSGLHYSDAVVRPFLRRHNALVRYGPPIDLSPWQNRDKNRTAYREVAEHVMEQILALRPTQ